MTAPGDSEDRGYDDLFREFDSPLMQQVRLEAYGQDIGQHSWVTAEDLAADIPGLKLFPSSRLLDLGCGPGGPLTFVVGIVGCHGTGTDSSAAAIDAGRTRAAALGLDRLIALQKADSNQPIPFAAGAFDAVMSLDVILHLRDRVEFFREVARVLVPGGRFLFTDAGVVTGSVSGDEIRSRSVHGYTQFVPSGFNESALQLAGLRLLELTDRTASLLQNATGRLSARLAHRLELEQLAGAPYFERQLRYLQAVIGLAQRGAMSRVMYLAELGAGAGPNRP